MKHIALMIAALLAGQPALLQADDEEVELVEYMSALQRYTHKIHLSLEAGNLPLAGFYAHEMEEVIEALEEIDEYDGHPVGKLMEERLEPAFEAFEDSLEGEGSTAPAQAFDLLLQSCNSCHGETDHAFIVIGKNPHNPFMQSFSPQP